MPLTVEPSKPRLCNDNRFLNLWMDDRLFSLDHLHQLSLYISKGAYQTVCDDKSGYDHILLATSSRTFFGFEWNGWYFTSNTIPFGWKLSAFLYRYRYRYRPSCPSMLLATGLCKFYRLILQSRKLWLLAMHFRLLMQLSRTRELMFTLTVPRYFMPGTANLLGPMPCRTC